MCRIAQITRVSLRIHTTVTRDVCGAVGITAICVHWVTV